MAKSFSTRSTCTRHALTAQRLRLRLGLRDRPGAFGDAVRAHHGECRRRFENRRLQEVQEKSPQTGKVIRDIAPAAPGAKDWQPCAFSPRTGYLYIPHQNLAMDFESTEANYIEGTPYVGANVKMYAGADDPDKMGYFTCWDLLNKKIVWRKKEMFP